MTASQNERVTGEVEIKALESLEIKDESTGEVEAIIATLDVVDKDFEVITKDAITSGSKVKMSSYGHDIVGGFMGGGELPVGRGAVFVEQNKAIFRGKIFVTTERGRDTLAVLKEMGKDQEWSFGFLVIGSEEPDEKWRKRGAQRILTKLDVFEVSPVVIGAGIGTRTVAAKAVKDAVKEAVQEVDEEAKAEAEATRKTEEEATAKKVEEDALAAKQADEEAAYAEYDRVEAEKKTAEETEAKRVADEAAAEQKRKDEEAATKARARVDREEYERVQRALRRMGLR
jgi:hypothetical protein